VDSATVVIIVAAAIASAAWQLFSLSDNPGRAGCANNMERNVPPSRRSAIAKRLELRRRETRAGKFTIPQLSASESDRYAVRWRKVQGDFVDSPAAAIAYAADLLSEVMTARGYPTSDFEQRAADLSVENPTVVSNYRAAHEVAVQHASGEGGNEDLRRAMLAELVAPASPVPTSTAPTLSESRTFREEAVRDARGAEDDDTRSRNPRDVRERLDGAAPLT